MDENGNETKMERVLEVSDVQDDGTTTVTIEKTVRSITKTTVVTEERQAQYEYIRDEDAHVYAEVNRTTTEVHAEITANNDQGTADKDEDYVNAGEVKEVTVTIVKSDDVTTKTDDATRSESNDDVKEEEEREREGTAVVQASVVKTEVIPTALESHANQNYGIGEKDDDDRYVNNNELAVHNLRNADTNEVTYDVALNVNVNILSKEADNSEENIFEAAIETHGIEDNVDRDAVSENNPEDSEVKTGSVTVTKTVTRTEVGNEDEKELEIRSVSVTITKAEVNEESEEHDYLVPTKHQDESREMDQEESLRDRLQEHREELHRAEIESVNGESVSSDNDSRKQVEIEHVERKEVIEEVKEELREQVVKTVIEERREMEEVLEAKAVDNTPALYNVTPEPVAHRVDVEASIEQKAEVKSPTGIKSPSTSGTFVLRNSRQKDAMHFMQHVRNMASGHSNDLEKGEILTVLRSTSRDETVTSGKQSRGSVVTTGLVQQFEMASVGGGAVFPKSPSSGTLRSTSIEGKQAANNIPNPLTSEKKTQMNNKEEYENKTSNTTVVIKTTTVKGSSVGDETAQLEVKTVTVTKEAVKSSEILAKELELKLQAKEELRKQEEQKSTKTEVTSNGIKTAQSNGESLVRPSTLSRQTSGGAQAGLGVEHGNKQDPRIPQWQRDLMERNRSKRVSSGSVTPTSPSQTHSETSPQTTPPWMNDLQMRKVKVKSISDADESGK